MAKKIALYENAEWQKNTPQSPGISFEIPANEKNPQNHPSFSKTNQSDAENTDINKIMARYEKSGMIEDLITGEFRKPVYGDFTNVGNFYELKQSTTRAQQLFDALPAAVRSRFDNDPQKLIEFVNSDDEKQNRELVDMGLMTLAEFDVLHPPVIVKQPENPQPPAAPATGQPVTAA